MSSGKKRNQERKGNDRFKQEQDVIYNMEKKIKRLNIGTYNFFYFILLFFLLTTNKVDKNKNSKNTVSYNSESSIFGQNKNRFVLISQDLVLKIGELVYQLVATRCDANAKNKHNQAVLKTLLRKLFPDCLFRGFHMRIWN